MVIGIITVVIHIIIEAEVPHQVDYFHERCGDDGKSNSRTFYSTLHPFYSDKGNRSSGNIQLLENNTLVTQPADVVNVMNSFYVNITSTIGEPMTEEIMELDDDDFIALSQETFKDHPTCKTP